MTKRGECSIMDLMGGGDLKNTKNRIFIAHNLLKLRRLGIFENRLAVFEAARLIKGCSRNSREANSLFAAWALCRYAQGSGRMETLEAFEYVYRRKGLTSAGDVSARVVKYAMLRHQDPRTVYRRMGEIERTYEKILEAIKKDC